MLPDENDLDFTWSITDDGGGILVTPAVQNLTVNLEETQRHVVPITQRLSPPIHLYINLPFCHLLLTSPPPPTHTLLLISITRLFITKIRPSTNYHSNGNLHDKSTVQVLNALIHVSNSLLFFSCFNF